MLEKKLRFTLSVTNALVVRVVHGSESEFVPAGIQRLFRNRSRNGTFLWLTGTGTGIPVDCLKNVTELLP